MIQGPVLLLGDSITVGVQPFVKASGPVLAIAEGNKTSAWLLAKVTEAANSGLLAPFQNGIATLLIGTNDVGGYATAENSFSNIQHILSVLSSKGIRPYVMTVPPFKGWKNYESQFAAIDTKRKRLNDLIRGLPQVVIPLDTLTADPQDLSKLAASYDSGDHLHLNKARLGALVTKEVSGGASPPAPPAGGPLSGLGWLAVLGAAGVGYAVLRRRKFYRQ